MFGRYWSREEKEAYRAAFTLGRIVDEIWIVIACSWFAVYVTWIDDIGRPWNAIIGFGVFMGGGLAVYSWLPSLVRSTMPAELRNALPDDRFAGPSALDAPRTYRELFRRWVRRDSI